VALAFRLFRRVSINEGKWLENPVSRTGHITPLFTRAGKLRDLGIGAGLAYGINNQGEVVGEYNGQAFIYRCGKIQMLGTEAKLEFTITVNWRREDGSIATTQVGTLDRGACRSAEDVGLQLSDAKPILGRLQEIVVSEELERYCETVRPCPAVIVGAT
jgi:hypothetical protein